MPRHWRGKMGFDPPPHWTEEMEAACREAPGARLLPWLPEWALWLACGVALGLMVWATGSWPRIVQTLRLHWPGR